MCSVRRLAFNSIVLTVGSYVAQAASVLTYVLAARALGPSRFGLLLGLIGVAVLLSGFADFGINGWLIRSLAQSPASVGLFRQTLTSKLVVASALAAIWLAVSMVAFQHTWRFLPSLMLAGYLMFLVVAGTLTVPFRASESMLLVSIVGTVEKLVALAVWLILSAGRQDAATALGAALLVGAATSALVAAAFVRRDLLALSMPSIRDVVFLWRSSYNFGMVGLSAGILRADVAIVTAAAGSYAAGIYGAPARITSFLTIVPASFSAAMFPRIARLHAASESRRQDFIATLIVLGFMTLMIAILAAAAPFVIPLALGDAYSASVTIFRVYLLAVLVNSANQPLLAVLQAESHERYAGRVVVASAIGGLVVIGVGANIGGAAGAALGAAAIQVFQLGMFIRKLVTPARTQHEDLDSSLTMHGNSTSASQRDVGLRK
jgi:O-antigen/teichoic acid export membrane protein